MFKLFRHLSKLDLLFIFFCLICTIGDVWLSLRMPDYTAKLTEDVSAGILSMQSIRRNGGMMLLCGLGSSIIAIGSGFFTARFSSNYVKTLRSKVFDKIMHFSSAEVGHFTTSSLITRTTNDVGQVQSMLTVGVQMLFRCPLLAVMAILKISFAGVEWTEATAITVAFVLLTLVAAVLICLPKFKKMQKLTDDLNTATRESIGGVRVIRAFNAERYQQGRFNKVNDEITRVGLFTGRTLGAAAPFISVAINALTIAIYWIGAVLINRAPMAERAVVLGNMTAFTQYAMQIVVAFLAMVMVFMLLPSAMVSAKRLNEVLDTEPSMEYKDDYVEPTLRGEIEFRNVAFRYADAASNCIEDISFRIRQGETFAVIGATGAGKTTLINLIARLYDATEGEVLLDGVNVKEYPAIEISEKVALAPQRAILFKDSIKNNITYGTRRDVPDDDPELLRALSIAETGFIQETEGGLAAEVSQDGSNFSGGQRQRLSIARAIFRGAEIMVFDDSFSALDYRTDMLVRRAIRRELGDTTVVVVAQRIGTVKNADQILVLDNGRIAGLGKHEELLESCSVYREIALSQLNKEELSC